MKIETRFDIGQEVCGLDRGAFVGKVTDIKIKKDSIEYTVLDSNNGYRFGSEESLFATKEELLDTVADALTPKTQADGQAD